jgi:hypothetical protein
LPLREQRYHLPQVSQRLDQLVALFRWQRSGQREHRLPMEFQLLVLG